MVDVLKLMEMLSTRLCHDLTGPIGAINNGVEFLSDEEFDLQGDAFGLIASSAKEAITRLQFYRQAFGRAGAQGEACLSEKKSLVQKFLSSTRVELDWPDAHTDSSGVPLNHRETKLMLNIILIATSVLVRGGVLQVRVGFADNGDRLVSVEASGQRIKEDLNIPAILEGSSSIALTPENAIVFYARLLMEEVNASLQQVYDSAAYVLKIRLPAKIV
jgi:histidine phosphotransferase ChpT